MLESKDLHGIIPPIITPLTDHDQLDVEGLQRLVEHIVPSGINGVFVLGTSGEGPGLSRRLRKEMVEQTCKFVDGRVPVLVGITDTSIVEALDMAKHSKNAGASAVVAAPPFYFPAGQTELTHFYTQLLEGLELPLMLYNMPSHTKLSIERQTLEVLVKDPNVIGIKDSSGDIDYLQDVINLAKEHRPDWPIFVGPEALLSKAMSMGACGGVSGGANFDPQLFVELYNACESQNQDRIDVLQKRVLQLSQLYKIGKYKSAFLKGIKCALELKGICSGKLAAPFDSFKQPQREKVAAWLKEYEAAQTVSS